MISSTTIIQVFVVILLFTSNILGGRTLYSFGLNDRGQFGNGTTFQHPFVSTPSLSALGSLSQGNNIQSVSAGYKTQLVVLTDGKVYGMGYNLYGAIGDGSNIDRTTPSLTAGFAGIPISKVSTNPFDANTEHTLFLTTAGVIYASGRNDYSQLGVAAPPSGSPPHTLVPMELTTGVAGKVITDISTGRRHSLACDNTGALYAWGLNSNYQLGDGTTSTRSTPKLINGGGIASHTIVRVFAGGFHSAALTNAGIVFTWGYNGYGQLGTGSTSQQTVPFQITNGLIAGSFSVSTLCVGEYDNLYLRNDGKVYGSGRNQYGMHGKGHTTASTPIIPIGLSTLGTRTTTHLACLTTTLVRTSDGKYFSFGENHEGQTGTGSILPSTQNSPVEIADPLSGNSIISLQVSQSYSSVLVDVNRQCNGVAHDDISNVCSGHGSCMIGTGSSGKCICDVKYNGTNCNVCSQNFDGYPNCGSSCKPGFLLPDCKRKSTPGHAYAFGYSRYGQFGNGTTSSATYFYSHNPAPAALGPLVGDAKIEAVSGKYQHVLVVTKDGSLYSMGRNHIGQLGDESFLNRNLPVKARNMDAHRIVAASAGWTHSMALTSDGRVFAFGEDNYGQLGLPISNTAQPTEILSLLGIKITEVSCGDDYTVAITDNGLGYGWGRRYYGLLGNGVTSDGSYQSPIAMSYMYGRFIKHIFTSDWHTMALTYDDEVYTFGHGAQGQLGTAQSPSSQNPTRVLGAIQHEKVIKFGAGYRNSFAITADGKLFGWGQNNYGQLGVGTTSAVNYPIRVGGNTLLNKVIVDVAAYEHTLVTTADNEIYAFGRNDYAQLSVPVNVMSSTGSNLPTLVGGSLAGTKPVSIAAGHEFSFVVTQIDRFCNGIQFNATNVCNGHGECHLGTGAAGQCSCTLGSRFVGANCDQCAPGFTGVNCDQCVSGFHGTGCNIPIQTEGGAVFAWGLNAYGQFGNGSVDAAPFYSTATLGAIGVLHGTRRIHTLYGNRYSGYGLTTDHKVYSFGRNDRGQLGDSTNTDRSLPVLATNMGTKSIIKISTLYESVFALNSDGTVFSWGYNGYGQLCHATTADFNTPTEIVAYFGLKIDDASMGLYHSHTLTSDGFIRSCGNRGNFRLGDGSTSSYVTSPVFASSLYRTYAKKVFAGWSTSHMIDINDELRSWGYGGVGNIANGANSDQSTPVLANGLLAGVKISSVHTCADTTFVITQTKKLLGFGVNNYGQLGDGSTSNRNTAVYVGGAVLLDKDVEKVGCYQTTLVLTSDGITYVFGRNDHAELGTSIPSSYSNVPTILRGATDGFLPLGFAATEFSSYMLVRPNRTCAGVQFDDPSVCNNAGKCSLGSGANGQCICIPSTPFTGTGCTDCKSPVLTGAACDTCIADHYGVDCEYSFKTGTLFGWGANEQGQLGNGTIVPSPKVSTPVLSGLGVLEGTRSIQDGVSALNFMLVLSNFRVYGWGNNAYGQLGDVSTSQRNLPVSAANMVGLNIIKIAAMYRHSVVLTDVGRVFTFGSDANGQTCITSGSPGSTPTEVVEFFPSGLKIIDISAGYHHTFAVRQDGKVMACGYRHYARLGDGSSSTGNYHYPILSSSLHTIFVKRAYAGSDHSHVLSPDGKLFSFGYGGYGALGNGATGSTYGTPIQVLTSHTIKEVKTCLWYSLFLTSDNILYGAGRNNYGQLADGTTSIRSTPIKVASTALAGKQVASFACHSTTVVSTTEGEIYTFGYNDHGQLGTGLATPSFSSAPILLQGALQQQTPVQVLGGGEAVFAVFNVSRRCAGIEFDNPTVCNGHGQCSLGVGDNGGCVCSTSYASKFTGANCDQCKPGFTGANCDQCVPPLEGPDCTRTFSTGYLYGWGRNSQGQMGNGSIDAEPRYTTPTRNAISGSFQLIDEASVGEDHTLLLVARKVWAYGLNTEGRLGDQTTLTRSSPVAALTQATLDFVKVSTYRAHSLILSSTGRVFSFGSDSNGQLGLIGSTTSTPTEIVTFTGQKIVDVSAGGYHSLAVEDDGSTFGWGHRNHARLGDGSASSGDYQTPVASSAIIDDTIVRVFAGNDHSLALDVNGKLLGFGYGGTGALGYGGSCSTCARIIPTVTPVKTVCAGYQITFALQTNGKLYAFGYNGLGSIGDGTYTNKHSPVFAGAGVIAAKTVIDVACHRHVVVATSDGLVYTFGDNSFGQLGTGSNYPTNSPHPIAIGGALAGLSILKVHAGNTFSSALVSVNRQCNGVQFNDNNVCSGHGKCILGTGASAQCVCDYRFAGTNCNTCSDNFSGYPACTACTAGWRGVGCNIPDLTGGSVYSWGSNDQGQFGNGTSVALPSSSTPTLSALGVLAGTRSIKQLSSGEHYTVAVVNNGKVYSWGRNAEGQLGDQTIVNRNLPVEVTTITAHNIVKVSAFRYHTLAVADSGRVFSWGSDDYGQLGLATGTSPVPAEITDLTGISIVDVSAGYSHSIAAATDGIGYGWGYQGNGRIGNAQSGGSSIHSPLSMLSSLVGKRITRVFAGYSHSFILTHDNSPFGFGYGTEGQLGYGTCTHCLVPAPPTGLLLNKKIKELCLGVSYTLAIGEDDKLYGFGRNAEGQLGDDTTSQRSTAVLAGGALVQAETVSAIGCYKVSMVATTSGKIFIWGNNEFGALGTGSVSTSYIATSRLFTGPTESQTVLQFAVGNSIANALMTVNRQCAGVQFDNAGVCNGHGACAVGVGAAGSCVCQYPFSGLNCDQCANGFAGANCDQCNPGLYGADCSRSYTAGTLMGWGRNEYGQFGNGTAVPLPETSTPTIAALGSLAGLRNIIQVSAGFYDTLVLTSDFNIKAFGRNANGQIGDGSTTTRLLPVTVALPVDVQGKIVKVEVMNSHSIALTRSGRVFTWGSDGNGKLGTLGSNFHIPVEVIDLLGKKMVDVSVGNVHTLSCDDEGFGYGWGHGGSGRIGNLGTSSTYDSPRNMGGALTGQIISRVSGGLDHSMALTTSGTVYGFGYGGYGHIGNGASSSTNHPVKVNGLLTGKVVIQICAGDQNTVSLTSDGKVYSWGRNNYGELGDETTATRNSPVLSGSGVLSTKTIVKIACYKSTLALTDDGKIFAWGRNENRELGNHFNSYELIPQPILHQIGDYETHDIAVGLHQAFSITNVTRTCDNIAFDDYSNVCSGHGVCVLDNNNVGGCVCNYLYPGTYCNQCSAQYTNYPACDTCISGFSGPDCTRKFTTGNALYGWGVNDRGQFGNGTTVSASFPSTPTLNALENTIKRKINYIVAAAQHTLILAEGKVWGYGYNAQGQLGDLTTTDRHSPVAANLPSAVQNTIVDVSSFYRHTMALSADGRVFSWGEDSHGQLGLIAGTTSLPTEIQFFAGKIVASISAGRLHSLASLKDGTTFGWGHEGHGRIGNQCGSCNANRQEPVPSTGVLGQFVSRIHAGYDHTHVKLSDGRVYGFGYSGYGTQGTGSFAGTTHPAGVAFFDNLPVKKICAGVQYSVVLATNDKLYGWGRNNEGELGDYTTSTRGTPILIGGGDFAATTFKDVACYKFTIAVSSTNQIWVMGDNDYGQMGLGSLSSYVTIPEIIGGPLAGHEPIMVAAGERMGTVLMNIDRKCNGTEFDEPGICSGHGECSLGIGNAGQCICPLEHPGTYCDECKPQFTNFPACDTCIDDFIGADCTRKFETPGSVYAWGANQYGQFGNGTTLSTTYVSTPTLGVLGPLAATRSIDQVSIGTYSGLALSQGKVYAWGRNNYGQLGDQTNLDRSTPIPSVYAFTTETFIKVDIFDESAITLTASGRVFTFGRDDNGQLGLPTGTTSTPTEIPFFVGTPVSDVASGDLHMLAVLPSGVVYGWGYNCHGRLGNSGTSCGNFHTPTLASAFTGVVATRVYAGHDHSFVLDADKKLRCFGYGAYGHCTGVNAPTNNYNVIVGGTAFNGFEIKAVSAGHQMTAVLRSDDKLYGFGRNNYGAIGDSTVSQVSTAKLMGGGVLAVRKVAAFDCFRHCVVATTDGNVYVMGINDLGQLGLGFKAPNQIYPVELEGPLKGQQLISVHAGLSFSMAVVNVTRQCSGVEFDNTAVCSGHGTCSLGVGAAGSCVCVSPFTGTNCDQCSGNYQGANCDQCIAGWKGAGCNIPITDKGSVFAWGANEQGQFGNGTSQPLPIYSTPTLGALGLLSQTRSIDSIVAGQNHMLAIANGNIYGWGNNNNGQTGDETTIDRNAPVQAHVFGQSFVKVDTLINHVIAITDSGAVYTWGSDSNGQLGRDGVALTPTQLTPFVGLKVSDIAAGYIHSMVVLTTGEVYGFGYRCNGRIGDTSTSCSNVNTPVISTAFLNIPIASVKAGYDHTHVVSNSGQMYMVGASNYGQAGSGTASSSIYTATHLQYEGSVLEGKTPKKLCNGLYYSLMIDNNDKLYGWGRNTDGQLGDGTFTQRNTPVLVGGFDITSTTVSEIACYETSVILTTGGVIYAFGKNSYANFGQGSILPTTSNIPFVISGPLAGQRVLSLVSGQRFGAALVNVTRQCNGVQFDDTANVCSGHGTCSLGVGDTSTGTQCVCVRKYGGSNCDRCTGFHRNYPACDQCVEGYFGPLCELRQTGNIYGWGRNDQGQLGDGLTTQRESPQAAFTSGLLAAKKFQRFSSNYDHTLIISEGIAYASGINTYGQLGDGSTTNTATAVLVQGLGSKVILKVGTGLWHSLIMSDDGVVFAFGRNNYGQLGVVGLSQSTVAVEVVTFFNLGKTVTQISAGRYHSLACTDDGIAYSWGLRSNGRLADGSSSGSISYPNAISSGGVFSGKYIINVAAGDTHSLFLTVDGEVFGAGQNSYGNLGYGGSTATVNVATRMLGDLVSIKVKEMCAGSHHSFVITEDNDVYGCGRNNDGQLGDATFSQRSTPIKIGGSVLDGKKFKSVGCFGSTAVVTDDGKLYTMGANNYGQLGSGSVTPDVNSPVLVDVLGAEVTLAQVGEDHMVVFVANGTDVVTCFGVPSTEPNTCAGHGSCTANDNCNCNTGFGSGDCSQPFCYGILSGNAAVCGGHGTCNSPDSCTCANGYSGNACNTKRTCHGVDFDASIVCSGHGTCSDQDTCTCDSGYTGFNCTDLVCYGVAESNAAVCSGEGSCVAEDSCSCNSNHTGSQCQFDVCYGLSANASNVCAGHGTCASPDSCSCISGYGGNDCSLITCFGLFSNDQNVCSGHGTCVAPNQCQCQENYLSDDCNFNCTFVELDKLSSIHPVTTTLQFVAGGTVSFKVVQNTLYKGQTVNVTLYRNTSLASAPQYNDACDFNNAVTPYYNREIKETCTDEVLGTIPFENFKDCSGLEKGVINDAGIEYWLYRGVFVTEFFTPVDVQFGIGFDEERYLKHTTIYKQFSLKLQKQVDLFTPLNVTSAVVFYAAAVRQEYNYQTSRLEVRFFFVADITGGPTYSLVFQSFNGSHPITVSYDTFTCPGVFETEYQCQKFLIELDNEGECSFPLTPYDLGFTIDCNNCFVQGESVVARHVIAMEDVCDIVDEQFDVTASLGIYSDTGRSLTFPTGGIGINSTAYFKAELSAPFAPIKQIRMNNFYLCSANDENSCTGTSAENVIALVLNKQLTVAGSELNFLANAITAGNNVDWLFQMRLGFCDFCTTAISRDHLNTSNGEVMFHADVLIGYTDDPLKRTTVIEDDQKPQDFPISMNMKGKLQFSDIAPIDTKSAASRSSSLSMGTVAAMVCVLLSLFM